uniref:Kinetochore associated 1 n=1 Tax=Jaculus jaculus TaxID=51337 RepID=A0A8C5KSQ6_JACJA
MWNDIELLNSDDTGSGYLSVGLRKENETALYQVDLLVKISSEKASLNPKIQACCLSDGFLILAEQSVILLDSICKSLQLYLIFVDIVCLCQEGNFLFTGERSGNLHLIHVTSKQTLFTNLKSSFICICIYHCLGCLNLVTGEFASGTTMIIGVILINIFSLFCLILLLFFSSAKKFQLIDNLLFVLDTDHVLSMWDICTLTPVWNWPSLHIEDFLLTTEVDSPSSLTGQGITNLKLVVLTTTTNKKMKNLMVYSLPTMEMLYSLEVSSISSLGQIGISTVSLYSVSVLVLRYLTEALPENRLSRLLHKHRFAEAESFAIQFGLDVEVGIHLLICSLNRRFLLLKKEDKSTPAYSDGLMEVMALVQYLTIHSIVCQLKTLVNNLQDLVTLHRKYNCKLALSDFEKENTTTIVFRMFDRVLAPELIPSALEKYIRVYMQEHDFQEEELLLLYIEDLLRRCSSKFTSLFETAWEAKAIAVIGCLSDTDHIFDAVLKIMHKAVVPWSAAVEQLVKQHLEMDHPKLERWLSGYGACLEVNLLNKEIMRVVRYILKQDVPSSLEDALKVAQVYMLPDDEIYSLRIIDLIDREQGENCLLLLRSVPPTEAEKTAERVIIWARLALQEEPEHSQEDKSWRVSVAKTSVNILKILCDTQKGNLQKKNEYEEMLKQFKVVASLQENFEVFLPFEDYSNSALVEGLQEQYIKTHEDVQAKHKARATPGPTTAKETGLSTQSKLHRQAVALQMSAQELEAALALRALKDGKVGVALNRCRDLFNYHCNASVGQFLFLVCQKLCQMLANDIPVTAPVGLNLPSEIHDLACKAATICSPDFLLDALELCKCTLTAVELSRQCQMDDYGLLMKTSFGAHKDPYEEWSYSDFFNEDGIVLESQVVLPIIYELISSLVPLTESKRHPLNSTSLPYCSMCEGKSLISPIITSTSALLQNLQESSQGELALRFVVASFGAFVQHSVSNTMNVSLSEKLLGEATLINSRHTVMELKEKSIMFIRGNASTLLNKVFNCRLVDLDLALGYCTLIPRKDVFENLWKLIDKAWQNYDKILALSLVGSQLAALYRETEIGLQFHELSIDAQWGIRLGKLGISFQPAFRQNFLTKKELIKALVKNIDMDTSLILEYCSTFQLDCNAALQLFIETLLHNTNNQSQGDLPLMSSKQQHSKLLDKAIEMVPLLTSTKDLVISLSGILYKLDPYDYEMIEVVLKVIERADEKITNVNINQALNLLKHLKSYRRISPPVDLEYQYMLEHKITLPSAAQTRLPFHLILFGTAQNFWKIISSELSEESLPTLLLISKLMKFSLDTLYVSTAKHVFEKNLRPKLLKLTETKPSALMTKEVVKLTQTVKSYLLSIVNPEWAVATAITLTQEIPEGPFKMASLKFCLYLAERWLQNIPPQDETCEKAQALLKKLHLQFRRSGTEAVLIAHKLNTAEHLRAIGKPAHLIVSLYEHPSISERMQTNSGKDFPDIHTAAKEIAEVNEINLEKIWDMLLEKWLCPSAMPGEKTSKLFELQEDETLRRVVYLLLSRPIDYSSRMLFVFATSTTSPLGIHQLTFAHKARALQCLLYLADKETIESLFKKPIQEVKSYWKCLNFLASFETLNIPITFELFCSSPKEGMIKDLWKNHRHEPMAVKLVAELCLEYKIYNLQLWNGLLQKLLGFNMITYLRKVLTAISSVHSLWQVPYFSKAWQHVVQMPLLSASCPLSSSQLSDCCESLIAVLECPVSDDLDMVGVARQFIQLELPAFALACLMLMPHSEKKHQQIKNFLFSCNAQIILQQLEEHMNTGPLAGFSHQIRSLILNNVISKKEFGILAKTKYFQVLKLHAINANNITELVNYLASDLSLDEASALITEYSKHCGKPVPPDAAPSEVLQVKPANPYVGSNLTPFLFFTVLRVMQPFLGFQQ